jgi:lysophospholipase L1-like esterase
MRTQNTIDDSMRFRTNPRLSTPTFNSNFTAVFALVVLTACTVFGQNTQTSTNQPTGTPLNMLVLGDSIMWGQGLKKEHKSWYHVKLWLEKATGRVVIEKIDAHSGAVVELSSTSERLTATNPEVDVGLPTLNDELDNAERFYSDRSKIDVVLVSGCANDVGLQNLLNATATEQIDEITEAKCGPPMERLLRRITTSFPVARVVVSGYYPFFSEKTRNDFVLKALVKRFFKIIPGTPKLSSKEVLERLTANSNEWYRASNKALWEAVRRVNAGLEGEPQRIMFAKVDFSPEHSFAAPQSHLWQFNRSPFRMLMVLLSFGKIMLPSNDDVRKQRSASCKDVFKRQENETPVQKKEREQRRLLCRYAALGHPNQKGALLYADAIMKLLKPTYGATASGSP